MRGEEMKKQTFYKLDEKSYSNEQRWEGQDVERCCEEETDLETFQLYQEME